MEKKEQTVEELQEKVLELEKQLEEEKKSSKMWSGWHRSEKEKNEDLLGIIKGLSGLGAMLQASAERMIEKYK